MCRPLVEQPIQQIRIKQNLKVHTQSFSSKRKKKQRLQYDVQHLLTYAQL
jgi:hypothetical protein